MPRVHSHYENLKVARDAPIEVIEAAYAALYAKYNPDLNPYNEMVPGTIRIVKRSYEVLSDPIRRAEHDRWIRVAETEPVFTPPTFKAAEEHWIQEWISDVGRWTRRNGYWGAPALVIVLLVAGVLIFSGKPSAPTETTASSLPDPAPLATEVPQALPAPPAPVLHAVPASEPKIYTAVPNDTQRSVRPVPYRRPDVAPDGQPWPDLSAYLLDQIEDGNSTVTVDNTRNSSDMLVELFDLGFTPTRDVRVVFLRAREQFALHGLRARTYDIRYQNLDSGVRWKSQVHKITEDSDYSLTLYTVPSGNDAAVIIGPDEFDSTFLRGLPRRP